MCCAEEYIASEGTAGWGGESSALISLEFGQQ
jgi:hypothetical protein